MREFFQNIIVILGVIFIWQSLIFAQDHSTKLTNQLPAEEDKHQDKQKVIRLFNGKNLDGWYTFIRSNGKGIKNDDTDKIFSVKDGLICVSGAKYGCITTNEIYENYILEVEYKVGEHSYGSRKDKAFDSGILIHSNGKDGGYDNVWMKSIEIQVIEGGSGDFYVVSQTKDENFSITTTVDPKSYDKKGSGIFSPNGIETTVFTPANPIRRIGVDQLKKTDVARFRNINEIEKPHGEWNLIKIIANNDKINVYLNGQLVNKAKNVKPKKGKIQIQSEGAEFFYKRIDLIPLK
ncbi:MAG: DUF1080 domain-containing protein [Planctomycetaceae bacterium]|jgi:hypothetical protein|nr:DUF1080 domain-containing protein [Planctomycetaceae bacterium]